MRLNNKPLSSYPWHVRLFFWLQKRKFGFILNPNLLWGRKPRMMYTMALFYSHFEKKSSLPPFIRLQVMLRTSQINACSFCIDMNSARLIEDKHNNQEKLDQLSQWPTSPIFTPREKAALAYAEAITYTDQEVTDKIHHQLQQHFNEEQIIDLAALIAFQNLSSKFNNALDIEAQGMCQY